MVNSPYKNIFPEIRPDLKIRSGGPLGPTLGPNTQNPPTHSPLPGAILHVEKSIKFAKVKFSDWDPKTHRKSNFCLKEWKTDLFFYPSQRISAKQTLLTFQHEVESRQITKINGRSLRALKDERAWLRLVDRPLFQET